MSMTEKMIPDPDDLVREMQVIRSSAIHEMPSASTLSRLMTIIHDLSWFRFYGFKHEAFEKYLAEDPAIQHIYNTIEEQELKEHKPDGATTPFNLKTKHI